MNAIYHDGILTIKLPTAEGAKARRIRLKPE